jgi:hypothetical protein
MSKFLRSLLAAIVLATIAFSVTGCVSDQEPENLSEKPWNSPAGFGTGMLPSNINEGR